MKLKQVPGEAGEEDELLTGRETSETLKVPEATLTDWRYRGKGPEYVRVGRGVRYRRTAIDRWLEARTVRPGAA